MPRGAGALPRPGASLTPATTISPSHDLSLNLEFSRHSAVVTAFQQHFVRPGALGREHYDAFRAGFELRQTADYGAEVITTAREAADLLRRGEAFVEAAEALLRRSG